MIGRILSITLFLSALLFIQPLFGASTPFTVVIDAGHGGKDPGTLGKTSREKDVVLAIALKLGNTIKTNDANVKVIFTRSTDEYIELNQRANIANKAKANLFISVHADHAESPSVKGASTFTLGQNRTSENMAIAKRENSVILLEDNYAQRYEGFDPNSPESYIMFEFMQSNYMDQSIRFASNVQHQFKQGGRLDRGVRQDVFLVLRNTSMPSVLIEVGFLSNAEEEKYLNSEQGQQEVANNIFKGFANFKADYERKSTSSASLKKETLDSTDENNLPVKPDIQTANQSIQKAANAKNIVFKVQILAIDRKLKVGDRLLKGFNPDYYLEKGLYKYTLGKNEKFEEANSYRQTLSKSFPDCFVIAFKNGEKISVDQAKAELGN